MNGPYKKSWPRQGFFDKNGVWRNPTTVHRRKELNPRSGSPTAHPPVPPPPTAPSSSPTSPRQPSRKKKLAVTVAATAAVGVVAFTASLSGSGGSLNVQVKADLTQSIVALAKIGFDRAPGTSSSNPSYGTDCKSSATGQVKLFLTQHPCKEFATATLTTARSGTTAQVAISWVVMPTINLATQYKTRADTPGEGNPPGQSGAFTGLCYSSGQDGDTVWSEQVQPTGNVDADREILQAVAPETLSSGYLQQHCEH
jgi:hypothetical protein